MTLEEKRMILREIHQTILLPDYLRGRLAIVEELQKSATSLSCSHTPRVKSKRDLSDVVVKLEQIKQQLTAAEAHAVAIRTDFEMALIGSTPNEYKVMTMRYIEGAKLNDIAEKLMYSLRNVQRIEQRAVERIDLEWYKGTKKVLE